MRFLFFLWLLVGTTSLFAQLPQLDSENFETRILAYHPGARSGITEKNLSFGSMVLREVRSATKSKVSNFNRADYFNILSAFLTLNESSENIDLAFTKFLAADADDCEYLRAFAEKAFKNDKYAPVWARWQRALTHCPDAVLNTFDPKSYAKQGGFDVNLVTNLHEIKQDDQRYRSNEGYDSEKQNPIDQHNLQRVESLYEKHGKYLGRSLVGEELESVMWLVIQHSNLEAMRRYLPVIHQAVQDEELPSTPLKMLIDRVYAAEQGWQVFGSQQGVPLGSEAKQEDIRGKYGLDQ